MAATPQLVKFVEFRYVRTHPYEDTKDVEASKVPCKQTFCTECAGSKQTPQESGSCSNEASTFSVPKSIGSFQNTTTNQPTDVDGKLHQVHQVQRTSLPRYGFSMTARNPRMPSGCQTCSLIDTAERQGERNPDSYESMNL